MATVTKAWPDKRFNGHTNSSLCMFYNCIYFSLFSETKQHKSLKFAWSKNRTSDGKLFTCHCLELNPAHFSYGKDDDLLS